MKLALLAVCLSLVAAQQGTDTCQQAKFLACSHNLGTFWGVDTSMIWDDLSIFSNVINSLIKPPYALYNYVNICNGYSQFYACLGQANIRNCLGTLGFVGMGKSPVDAYSYEGFMADWRFKCGAGFFSVYENDGLTNCTQNTYVNYANEMNQFFNAYYQNIGADPTNACTYAQSLMNSLGNVYATGPCRSSNDVPRARWYGCQSAREYTNAQFRHCQQITKCDSSITPSMLAEVRDGVDGDVEFLLPEHFEKVNGEWIKQAAKWI